MRIRQKLILLFLISGLPILILLTIFLNISLKNQSLKFVSDTVLTQIENIDSNVNISLDRIKKQVVGLSTHKLITKTDSNELTDYLTNVVNFQMGQTENEIIRVFQKYSQSLEFIDAVYMGREDGSFVSSVNKRDLMNYDPRVRPWYTRAKKNPDEVIISDPYKSLLTGSVNIGISKALLDKDGKFYGVVTIDMSLDKLSEFIKNIKLSYRGNTIVVDQNGLIIASSRTEEILKSYKEKNYDNIEYLLDNTNKITKLKIKGVEHKLFIHNSKFSGWNYIFMIQASVITDDIDKFLLKLIPVLAVTMAILFIVLWGGVNHFILKALTKLEKGTNEVKNGDDLDYLIEINSNDEIGELASSFNAMTEAIRDREKRLKESQEKLENILEERSKDIIKLSIAVEQNPSSIMILDKYGKVEYANKKMLDNTNLALHEVVGKSPNVLKINKSTTSFYDDIQAILKTGRIWNGEFSSLDKNDNEIWLSASISPISVNGEEITHYVAVHTDITEQKGVQDVLKKSSQESRQILNSVGEGIIGLDPKGNISFVNNEALKIFGEELHDVLKLPIKKFIDKHINLPENYHFKESIFYEAYMKGEKSLNNDFLILGKDDKLTEVEINCLPIIVENLIVGAVIAVRDITELVMLQRNFMAMLDYSSDYIFLKDNENRYTAANQNFANLLNVDNWRDLLGKTNEQIVPNKEINEYFGDDKEILDSGEAVIDNINSYFDDDMRLRWLKTSKVPIRNQNGDITGLFGFSTDITPLIRLNDELHEAKEVAEAATEAKGDFLANMSHEIRTPMNAIIGLNTLLSGTILDEKQLDYVTKIGNSANNLLGIINDILDFSKIEAGKIELEKIEFNLEKVLENISTVLGFKAFDKGLELLISIDKDVPLNLIGDPLRLGQILLNLTSNAIKFTEYGEVLIKISFDELMGENIRLKFEVIDTGIGLTKDQIKNLFKAFSQADSSTTRKYGGTGLGLSISKHLTSLMNGDISVESKINQGSKFYFTAEFGLTGAEISRFNYINDSLNDLRVLIVDDNESVREITNNYLSDFNLYCETAKDGEEAYKKVIKYSKDNSKSFDLILMDWNMPVLNGIDSWAKIRKKLKKDKLPKIILVTSYGKEDVVADFTKEKIDKMLTKPIGHSILYDSIVDLFCEKKVNDLTENSNKTTNLDKIRGANILLVEDNEINQQVAKELLEHENFIVTVAENGQIALDYLKENPKYDLILMDLQMPVLDGFATTEIIKNSDEFKNIPIIALSADAMHETKEKVLQTGMVDYITKPIDVDRLFSLLQKWINPLDKPLEIKKQENKLLNIYNEGLKQLGSLNVVSGLKRLAGNEKLYYELLVKFKNSNNNFTEKINKLIEELPESGDEINRAFHSLKGVAGNIGALRVQHLAKEMEKKSLQGKYYSELYKKSLFDLETELKRVCNEISSMENKIEFNDKKVSNKEFDQDKIVESLKRLLFLLKEYDTDAKNVYEELKKILKNSKYQRFIIDIGQEIGKYNFDKAILLTNDLINEFANK